MNQALSDLIAGARAAAGTETKWEMDGGRACPIGWWDCSQPVFRDLATGAWDYGDPGGPGAADCEANCPHHMQPAPDDDEDEEVVDLRDGPDDEESNNGTCPACYGTGGDPWNDGITPCEECNGQGYR